MPVIEANKNDFFNLIDTEYAVVDFYRDNCGGCVYMEPFFTEASNDMHFIRFIRLNIDTCPKFCLQFTLKVLPTLIFYHHGKEVHRVEDGLNREQINEQIAKMLYEV